MPSKTEIAYTGHDYVHPETLIAFIKLCNYNMTMLRKSNAQFNASKIKVINKIKSRVIRTCQKELRSFDFNKAVALMERIEQSPSVYLETQMKLEGV